MSHREPGHCHCPGCQIPLSDGYSLGCKRCQDRRSKRLTRGQAFTPTGYPGELIDNHDPRGEDQGCCMTDHEQIRRETQRLQAELEQAERDYENLRADFETLQSSFAQAERERDEAREHLHSEGRLHRATEARLAQAEKLAEAAKGLRHLPQAWIACTELNALDDALADWERKGGG